jgi:GTP-binding protein
MKLGPKPIVTIIGRPNVGKSTLFNTLIEEKKSIISDIPGTTRDFITGKCSWQGQDFTLVDTGGLEIIEPQKIKQLSKEQIPNSKKLTSLIEKKNLSLLQETDLILFLIDAKIGPLPQEKTLALVLKRLNKPILLVANKTDNQKTRKEIIKNKSDWLRLNLGEPIAVSAVTGSGTGDLLDEVVKKIISPEQEIITGIEPIKIAIVGKPNVGKSSLLNAMLGEERVIVSEMPYTTRESIDTFFEYKNQPFILIDTAGIRKKGKISPGIERESIKKSLASIVDSDIIFLVTETQDPITVQDARLARAILDSGKGVAIIANKWDLIRNKDTNTQNKFVKYYYRQFPQLSFAPLAFISAMTKEKVNNLLDLAMEINQERGKQADPDELFKIIKTFPKEHKLKSIRQIGIKPPRFLIESRAKPPYPDYLAPSITKRIREKFSYMGTPINVSLEFIKQDKHL